MIKSWRHLSLFLILLLAVILPFGCCTDCDDSPADPGDPDGQAPDTTIDSGPEGTVTSGDVSFTWSGTDPVDDPGDLTFSWILQPLETEWSAYDGSTMVNYTGLEDGTYTFKVRARNSAGLVDATPAERTFTVNTGGGGDDDITPPDTQITDGPDGTVNISDVFFEWTGTDDTDQPDDLVFSWRMDGGSWSSYNGDTTTTITGLADGSHTFEVRARDTAGNVDPSPDSRTFEVDTEVPGDTIPPETVITSGPSGTIETGDVTFGFTGSDNEDPASALVYSHKMDAGAWSSYSGSTSATYNGLSDGPHTFLVRARDTSGNVDPSPAERSFVVDSGEPPDTEPPTVWITSGPSGTIDYSDVTFTYEGDDNVDPPSALVFRHRMDSGAWSGWSSSTTAQYNGLADGPHTFAVMAMDTSNNVSAPASQSFTVDTGGGEGVVIESGIKNVTGNPGEYVVIDVEVTSHLNSTADFRFWATSTPADWENAYCVPGVCVPWSTVIERPLEPGANACSVDFSIPLDATSGTVSTIHFYLELVSDPSVSDDNVYTCTVN